MEKHRQRYGWNELQKENGKLLWKLILGQFDDTLVKILLGAAFISFILAYVDKNDIGEQKTKPTQHSVRALRGLCLIPHLLACRSAQALEENVKDKLSQFCHVPAGHILNIYNVSNIWHVPLLLRVDLDLGNYEGFLDVILTRDNNITTGKYISLLLIKNEKETTWERLFRWFHILQMPFRNGLNVFLSFL